jgi:glycosyltransferase involved in cell wall biosynthesis
MSYALKISGEAVMSGRQDRGVRVLTIGNLWPPASTGGYERVWAAGVDALRAAGHSVDVLTTDAPVPEGVSPGDAVRELRWYWRDGEWLRPSLPEAWRIERHNRAVLDRALSGVDCVVWWAMGGMSLSLIDRVRRAGVPAVGLVGDGWMVYGPQRDRWPRRPRLEGAAHWLFISRYTAEKSGVPDGDLAYPGVDPARFAFAAPPADWGGRLAFVGRIDPTKGLGTAVAALDELEDVTLSVNGPGELPVHPRVSRHDGDPHGAYAAADAVVFPSEWAEPWGLVPLEAMSTGRPVIATGVGGSAEYLVDGENCLLFTPGDPAALAACVRRLAGDRELRERLVTAGRETAARYPESGFTDAIVRAVEAAVPAST